MQACEDCLKLTNYKLPPQFGCRQCWEILQKELEKLKNKASNEERIRMDYVKRSLKIEIIGTELTKERSHIKTCHITMENHHKEMALKDSWVKHHQGSVEAVMKDRNVLREKLKRYEINTLKD